MIGLRKGWFVDLAVEDDELLPEQSILGKKVGFATREVGGIAENNRIAVRLGAMEESLFEGREQADEQLAEPMKEGEHVVSTPGKLSNAKRIRRLYSAFH